VAALTETRLRPTARRRLSTAHRVGLHARPEAVLFHAAAAVRLKCAFGIVTRSCTLEKKSAYEQQFKYIVGGVENPARGGRLPKNDTCSAWLTKGTERRNAHSDARF